jgi:hypothetical protein
LAHGCEVSIIDAAALASLAPDGGSREPVKGFDAADAMAEWRDIAALQRAATSLTKPCTPRRRMNVLLLVDDGWPPARIASALFIDETTVGEHRRLYETGGRVGVETLVRCLANCSLWRLSQL